MLANIDWWHGRHFSIQITILVYFGLVWGVHPLE
jgi:hypothetical protein